MEPNGGIDSSSSFNPNNLLTEFVPSPHNIGLWYFMGIHYQQKNSFTEGIENSSIEWKAETTTQIIYTPHVTESNGKKCI